MDLSPAAVHARYAKFSVTRTAVPFLLGEGFRTDEVRAIVSDIYERHGLEGITLLVEQLAFGNLMFLLDNRTPVEEADKEATRAEILAIIEAREQVTMHAEKTITDRLDDRDKP